MAPDPRTHAVEVHCAEPTRLAPARVNGLPGVVLTDGDGCVQAFAFELAADGDRIAPIYTVRNPDKLTRVRL